MVISQCLGDIYSVIRVLNDSESRLQLRVEQLCKVVQRFVLNGPFVDAATAEDLLRLRCPDSHDDDGRIGSGARKFKQTERIDQIHGVIQNVSIHVEQLWILTITGQSIRTEESKNNTGQKGFLVVEPMCANPVSQADTLSEGVCTGFKQSLYKTSMHGKHVSVTGVDVQDMEHGWREIHPVTSITVQ